MQKYFRIRAKHFPRGWSFVQGARCLPILIGVPITGYLNTSSVNNKAGYYFSFLFVILGEYSSTLKASCKALLLGFTLQEFSIFNNRHMLLPSKLIVILSGAIILFFMDYWKNRHRHHHDQYCEIREGAGGVSAGADVIEPENLSQKLSDVHNSVGGGHSVILSDHESIKVGNDHDTDYDALTCKEI